MKFSLKSKVCSFVSLIIQVNSVRIPLRVDQIKKQAFPLENE